MSMLLLFSCKSPSQETSNSSNKIEIEGNLRESFDKKDEVLFLNSFPKNFENFKNIFGWDDENASPEPFYKEANNFVDYWFSLLEQPKYKKYENQIVSNNPYQGNDLFVFFGNSNHGYSLNLETTNFSEDGGNIVQDIIAIPNSKGFTIKTYFPDRGYFEKEYNLVPENNTWILKNIIYKTMSDNSENAVKYICDVAQNIDITKSGWKRKINAIPEENDRNKKCRVEPVTKPKKTYTIEDPDGFTNLRKEKNSTSEVLQKIKSGQTIEVLDNSGDWFLVKTKERKEGYIHKSRIKSK